MCELVGEPTPVTPLYAVELDVDHAVAGLHEGREAPRLAVLERMVRLHMVDVLARCEARARRVGFGESHGRLLIDPGVGTVP